MLEMNTHDVLAGTYFGQRVAEEEREELVKYFVETDLWDRILSGQVDVVYGPKGSGKSAFYTLLSVRRDHLFDRGILLVAGENPRGATAFQNLIVDPPASEHEFKGLWKLYLAVLVDGVLREYDVNRGAARELRHVLEGEDLVAREASLAALLRAAQDYVRAALRPSGVEAGVELDPLSGLPMGFKGRITFHEPSLEAAKAGYRSVDTVLGMANAALEEVDAELWITLDRLDVAFAESPELEQNALRALFQVYLDIGGLAQIELKIFLRSDIWRRITEEGFREASHITRHSTITWDRRSLMSLVVERAVENEAIRRFYGVDPGEVKNSSELQEGLFYRMCPEQVDVGPNKSKTFEWILNRTKDGTGQNAPRELIHFLNSLRDVQIRRLEVGDEEPEGENLFSRGAFKDALPEVSRVRLEQTIYAEYPGLKKYLEALRGEKTRHSPETLAVFWDVSPDEAAAIGRKLVEIGFFESRGSKEEPEYWVPFLYRDGLDMVQGTAEAPEDGQ